MIKNVFYQGKASGMTLQAFDKQAKMFSQGQRTTKLIFSKSERGQKAFALDYCAAGFVTEGEVKYCIAKLFSNGVKFATANDF